MEKLRHLLIIFLFLGIILSLNIVSAVEGGDYSNVTEDNGENLLTISEINSAENDLNSLESDEILLKTSESNDLLLNDVNDGYIIYVGQNTTENGNGSYENPFATLDLACNNTNGEDKVTLKIFNGTYFIGSQLNFNTSNLFIIGIGGDVIIKNMYNSNDCKQALGLSSSSSNFTISNIIFDASNYTVGTGMPNRYFLCFYGDANKGEFINCTFRNFTNAYVISASQYDSCFKYCNFVNFNSLDLFDGYFKTKSSVFKYCTFSDMTIRKLANSYYSYSNASMDSIWFGQNTIPNYMSGKGNDRKNFVVPLTRYAMFSVSEKYLGNNQFEIIGKLTWNGTENQDGMENFQPMTFTISSNTGKVDSSTVTLVNGTFKTNYTSFDSINRIKVSFGDEDFDELIFNTVNITIVAPSIYYGENQNITLKFSQVINSTISISVNYNTYDVKVNVSDSLNFTIPDILKEGNYTVNVKLNDESAQMYGDNSTTLIISKVSDYIFEVVTNNPKFGDNATITISLPDDVNGTVIIKLGNEMPQSLLANKTVVVNFTNLNADTYNITVTYSGNDKYVPNEKTASITVNPDKSCVEIEDAVFNYGETIVIPFNMTNAKGVTITVYNKNDDEVATNSSESNIITLDALPAGEYTLYAKTIVDDDNYESNDAEANLTINKANSTLDISDQEFTYATEAVINAVTVNSTGDIIATLMDENNDKIDVKVSGDNITLPLLDVGKYTLTVTTNVDENHNNVTKSATITITKAVPSMDVIVEPAENITVKDDVTLTVKLPATATGEVVIKVNGKKLYDVSANETLKFDLDNDAGDYIVDVIYSGDKNYEGDSATKEFTISKVETSITAKPVVFEEGNSSTMEVTIPDVESGVIFVDVADKKFYADINEGTATVLINGLVAGNYTAKISFAGDKKFNEATGNANVNVTPAPDIIGELEKIISDLNDTVIAQEGTIKNQTEQISALNDTVIAQEVTIKNQTEQISALNDTVIAQEGTIKNQTEQISALCDCSGRYY
ncbi:Ig-like domain-containing protein [uncultured Methanobrevibacter sp.]|uniref:Ig-like domain-containing protein n=1 Tax=uncultured Methanobrevibacter sp. TaxID=253161 RepID=UPI0025E6B137|nr:Ig-like domain-containing protein [uncultured Methanobrevibacter sp.]